MHPQTNTDVRFVDAVFAIQSLVSAGAPVQDAYQAIIDHAVALLNGDSGALRLLDLEDPAWTVAVASCAGAGRGERWRPDRLRRARGRGAQHRARRPCRRAGPD